MSQQTNFIKNRKKVQFANALVFAKIFDKGEITASVGALGSSTTDTGKTSPVTSKVLGWTKVDGDDRWVPVFNFLSYISDEYGVSVGLFAFSKDNKTGFYLKSEDTNPRTFSIKYWLYFI